MDDTSVGHVRYMASLFVLHTNFCCLWQIDGKVVVLGDTGVGKTCLVLRYVEGKFFEQRSSTIGASFCTKKLYVFSFSPNLDRAS